MLKPRFWSIHTHSRYSVKDGMPVVARIVDKAAELGYPALGLTDHGNVSGVVQLYKNCRKKGIKPAPGIELYVALDRTTRDRRTDHLTVVASSERGYRNLVHLSNLSATNFFYKPVVDWADLAKMSEQGLTEGLVVTSGCYFGPVVQTLTHQSRGSAMQVLSALREWFPEVYVELQHHGIDRDDGTGYSEQDVIDELVDIADTMSMPYVICQDSHYVEPSEQPQHDAFKSMLSWSDDPDDARFPGGPYSMASHEQMQERFAPQVFDRAMQNLADLADRLDCRIPELDTFSMKVPDVSKSGDAYFELEKRMTDLSIEQGWTKAQLGQAKTEMQVIKSADIAGYLLLVGLVCDYMREKDIWFITRGSASGSFIVYKLGITQVDPMVEKLRMDRFLSPDRTRPPDIDLDVEGGRRDEVVTMLASRFSVRQVGSHAQLGLNDDEDGKGSLVVKYQTTFFKQHGYRTTWEDAPEEDRRQVESLAGLKLLSGPGTHAAGYIVAPDEASVSQLPLTWMATRSAFVTAYGKKDVEACGFVKLDLLGSDTLTAMKRACTYMAAYGLVPGMEKATAREIFDAIPLKAKDTKVYRRISAGQTAGMFQLGGKSQKYGCRDMKPRNIHDIVAAQALFRPAMLQGGHVEEYIERRRGNRPVPVRHEDILAETVDTYGIALYQEQVMGLMRRIGMGPEELTDTLDAVKASNEASADAKIYLQNVKSRVGELALARGWTPEDVAWLVDSLVGYAEYSFNKAHSVSYGFMAYRSAWLATHYSVPFWAGVLEAYQGKKRGKIDLESMYLADARADDVVVRKAHVNYSSVSYSMTKTGIRKGLTSVRGVGDKVAQMLVGNAPYASLNDMGQRLPSRVGGAKSLALRKPLEECGGAVTALFNAGALSGLDYEES